MPHPPELGDVETLEFKQVIRSHGQFTGETPRVRKLLRFNARLLIPIVMLLLGCSTIHNGRVAYVGFKPVKSGTGVGTLVGKDCGGTFLGIGKYPDFLSYKEILAKLQLQHSLVYLSNVLFSAEYHDYLLGSRSCLIITGDGYK